jgi:hypothetical protein
MTQFSFAVPLAHLRDFESQQDFTFALSFLLIAPEYRRYVEEKCEAGQLVYIDNSFNETLIPADPKEMAYLWYKYKPTAVVSPDADDWDPLTMFEAYKALAALIPRSCILGIFRSDFEREFFRIYGGGGPTAVSYWWVDLITQRSLDKVHFLGLSKLDLVVRHNPPTLDTSQMIKMALRGQRFEDWAQRGVLEKHLTRETGAEKGQRLKRAWEFFHLKLTDEQLELATSNMKALKEYVKSRQVQLGSGELGYKGPDPSLVPESVDLQRSQHPTFHLQSNWPPPGTH